MLNSSTVIPRTGTLNVYPIANAFGMGFEDEASEVALWLAEGTEWSAWDAVTSAMDTGIRGTGPNGSFITSAYTGSWGR